jgi:sucrose-6-phosphate hydrolase SacC (GH32 family)
MYHLFYQDHVAISQNGSDGKPLTGTHGPDWGHAVSKDFIHWTHLREAIWNTEWYDLHAIYTGSTTIVDGKVRTRYTISPVSLRLNTADPGPQLKNVRQKMNMTAKTKSSLWRVCLPMHAARHHLPGDL